MEIPGAVREQLEAAGQSHLLAFWSELDDEQRQQLLCDIHEIDLNRVKKAYEGVKDELFPEKNQTNDQSKTDGDNIDNLMEPVPDDVTGSIIDINQEEYDKYRRTGSRLFVRQRF
jgi:UDP-N-acetylglucosamine/UDP-N-acetylgalactosamine diphosphorylase